MALVYTDETGRVLHWYQEYGQLNATFRAQGTEVPDEQMVEPNTDPWMQPVAFLVDGNIVWQVENRDPEDPRAMKQRLSMYELPGEHQPINP